MATSTPTASTHLAALVDASAALAALPAAAGPAAVFEVLYQRVSALLGIEDFAVSLYDAEAGLIRSGYVVADGVLYAADALPTLPLGSDRSAVCSAPASR
jgi:hypothetical protein